MRIGNTLTLPDDVKQTVLWYLENYWSVISAIVNQRNDILFGSVLKDLDVPIQNSQPSDVTFKKAELFTQLNLSEMIGWIRVINGTYKYFLERDKPKADLIWYTFIHVDPDKKTKTKIINGLHLSRDRYYKWLDAICGTIGIFAAGKRLITLDVDDKAI